MSLEGLTDAVVQRLVQEDAFLAEAMKQGVAVQKRGQGIFAYTCGGAHFIQGAGYAVARGFGSQSTREAFENDIPVLFYRFDMELAQVDALFESNPEYALILLEQRLKFTGHFVESAYKLAALGLYVPTDDQKAIMDRAMDELVRTVEILERGEVFAKLDEIRQQDEQRYLDFVGDSAHAVRGIDLALGRGTIRY